MAYVTSCRPTEFFLDSFRRYILSPPKEALRIVEAERAEIEAERKAFEEFASRLEKCDVDNQSRDVGRGPGFLLDESTGDPMASIRTAYRETVMEVAHYETVYGERLLENVAAELGPDLAQWLDPEHSVTNTDAVMTALHRATGKAVHKRRAFSECLSEEIESIETTRDKLSDLVGELDSITIPDWYQETFVNRLDSIAEERQEAIMAHPSPLSNKGVNLCDHLYRDEPWTYSVLTAVTRLRESVILN